MRPAVFKHRRTAADAWLERTNPLQGLSIAQAQAVFDLARAGNYARLQYLYSEIEKADPVLMTCVERRASALAGLGWQVSAKAAAEDPALAGEERDALEMFLSGLENLEEAVEHLGLAFFRGFSHVGVADALAGGAELALLDSWNFNRDIATGEWWWNPAAELGAPGTGSQVPVPRAELCTVVRPRAIDYPALSIFLRHAVAERDWGRFLERYGLPPVILTAPENTPDDQMQAFADAARDVADGLNSAMPAGTGVNYASEARGSDPFTAFVEHQEKLIVLLATGGTLTSLAEAGSGTLAGGAQMDVWEQIVRRDARIVSAALERSLCRPWLARRFPGRPMLVEFRIGSDEAPAPADVFDLGAKARAAGYRIEMAELAEKSGYSLAEEPQAQYQGAMFPQDLRNAIANPLQNARKGADGEMHPGDARGPSDAKSGETALLEAMASDLAPVRGRLEALLALPDAERPAAARALMEELPSLLPADPEMAAVLEEEMAKAFAEEVAEGEDDVLLENAITNPCPKCHRQMTSDGKCTSCEKRAANHQNGKDAWDKAVSTKSDVNDAMERDSIGKIDFIWGTPGTPEKDYEDGEGVSHVLAKHPEDAGMITGVIAYGDVYEDAAASKYYVIKKRNLVVLRKRPGRNSYLISGYKKGDPHKVKAIRDRCTLVEEGE